MTDNQIKRPSNEAIVCDCHRHNISCHMRTLEYDACGWRKTSPKNLWIFMKKCAKGGCCCCCTATIYGCYGCRSQTPDAFGYLFFLSFVLGDVCVCALDMLLFTRWMPLQKFRMISSCEQFRCNIRWYKRRFTTLHWRWAVEMQRTSCVYVLIIFICTNCAQSQRCG